MALYRYNANNLLSPGDRVKFESAGYTKPPRVFHAIIVALYRFGEIDSSKWRVLIDDGLGNPRTVKYERLEFDLI